jgi:4-hydroxybenzoyl-CoA thioesterase
MPVFAHHRRVTWAEVDVAGAVDLSTLTRYSMEALEQFFIERLGASWYQLHVERRVATPFVRAELQFSNAVRPADALAVEVEVAKLGRTSVAFRVTGKSEEGARTCWEGNFTCVFADADTLSSIPVPDAYRTALEC